MECETLSRYVDVYLDGELAPEERGEIEAHLRECDDCRRAVSMETRFRSAVRQSLLSVRAPRSLRDQVVNRVREGRGAMTPRWVPTLAAAAGIMAIMALGYGVVAFTLSEPDPARSAVAAHEASSNFEVYGDRARVDSFLRTRAPFAFRLPLEDDANVRLVGARVTRLGAVPAVVYLYEMDGKQFTVAQYKAPETAGHSPRSILGRESGFTVATYTDGGLVQTFVGDVPERDIPRILPAAWSPR
jgi:mycothiol system anti-sigma-R factor